MNTRAVWTTVFLALLSSGFLALPGQTQQRPPQLPDGVKVERDLEYARVGDKSLKLDLYRPAQATAPLPVIVGIHGGGWTSGSKEGAQGVRQASRGYAVACISYRLSGEAIFPAQIEDCKAAVRWLRANAKKYNLDPDHIAATGHSAGGHLSSLLGASADAREFEKGDNLKFSSRVQAVCALSGPTDFLQMDAHAVAGAKLKHDPASSPESCLVGGAIQENKDKVARANPITYVSKDAPPFLIIHGDQDPLVPAHQAEMLHEALKKAGVEVKLHIVKGAGHGVGGREVNDLADAFFDKHLKKAPEKQAPETPTERKEDRESAVITPTQEQSKKLAKKSENRGGLLFFPSYPTRDNTDVIANPNIVGIVVNIYWSDIEASEGSFDWSAIDRRIKPWIDGGKKAALRIMWSSSGNWPEPAAKHPTPQWVLDKGAVIVVAKQSQTQIPLVWDPIYQRYAEQFLREIARKFDGDPNILFVDVTPGAETNPYRFRRINVQEPEFKKRFLDTPASDGRKYSDSLWLETIKQTVDAASSTFKKTKLLVTLNNGSLDGPSQFEAIGGHCVDKGCMVGQNGLAGRSYLDDSDRKRAFLNWGKRTPLYFETVDASGGNTGSLMEVMKAAERIGCNYLAVYARDVLRGTHGQKDFDPDFEKALEYGASIVSAARAEPLTGFKLDSEKWTYKDDKVSMQGIFLKPEGEGPFPALLISHGKGGSPEVFALPKAREFIKWGFVCIAPSYTHVRGGTPGKPGAVDGDGASEENLRRAVKCLDILESLPYVDRKRIGAYGHSMGGFVTIGLAGTVPDRLKAAAITGSGIAPRAGFAAPSPELAEKVRTPFLIIHGSKDRAVRPEQSASFKDILDKSKVANERHVFEGEDHPIDQTKRTEVFDLLRTWFEKQGLLVAGAQQQKQTGDKPAADDKPKWVKAPIAAPNLHYEKFQSESVKGEVSYVIYLPPDYEKTKDKRYPVMYWLHGRGGAQTGLPVFTQRLTAAIEAGKTPPMLVVFPNGLPTGGWRDSEDGKQPVESMTIKDLIPHIDKTYRTIARREGRIVEGFSMGGSGAARLAFKYSDLFCAAGIMAGAFVDRSGTDGTPSALVERNAEAIRDRIVVRIIVGEKDGLKARNQAMHELLDKLKIKHEFEIIAGAAHSHVPLYDTLGDRNWAFYRKALGAP